MTEATAVGTATLFASVIPVVGAGFGTTLWRPIPDETLLTSLLLGFGLVLPLASPLALPLVLALARL